MTSPSTTGEDVWRAAAPHVLTALVHRYGDFDRCEDAVQEALLAAARQWPIEGLPRDPRAWLVTVASRRLIDGWRADRARSAREELAAARTPTDAWLAPAADQVVDGSGASGDDDDSLALLLLCCHPALAAPSQVALTLRAVAGLTTAQIARGFLVPEATMAQRISRAKARLREVGARFAPPPAGELPARVAVVAQVLYLTFTEAHTATAGSDLTDPALAAEALRLTRLLHALVPGDDEVTGLLALLLLTDARRPARTRADGSLVPLAEQDRALWDRARIAEGVALVEAVLPVGPVGPYQLQAAIAAVHDEAPSAAQTDWAQIDLLYTMLEAVAPGPVVTLNRAVAVAELLGPAAALALLDPLLRDRRLSRQHRVHAVHGHLLLAAGRPRQAREAFLVAAGLATSIPEQRYLNARVADLGARGQEE